MAITEEEYQRLVTQQRAKMQHRNTQLSADLAPKRDWRVPEKPQKKIIRQGAKPMNKTEARFQRDWLDVWKHEGAILEYFFEDVTLRLANGVRYTPDFAAYNASGGSDYYEIKGGGPIQDDSIVKIKCAAAKFTRHQFYLCQWKQGQWIIQKVEP